MMRFALTIIFLLLSVTDQNTSVSELRSLYKRAAEEETAARKLLELTDGATSAQPVTLGYFGVSHMMMAKHVGNPFKKFSYFNKGKEVFTEAIAAAPNNLELRFLRFAVQAETPGFLNYKQNLEEDKKVLLAKTRNLKDTELEQMILAYLVTSSALSDSEKENL
ncbi:hypothetical protein [Salinimicrobium oceani]|uniref:Uncharacterized protein n=1 Tax=Salinimicrobium oceani TaxID=2722702 RepID=A0ABX1CZM4_9FLAO|nr:hypothetical protein [Salinimicrobium oceani]NJW52829.1 hypothetical protein [Salinimicrobium oceani]